MTGVLLNGDAAYRTISFRGGLVDLPLFRDGAKYADAIF